jgi:hypothetical protein
MSKYKYEVIIYWSNEDVPTEVGKILLQRPGMFSGGGIPCRAGEVASDAALRYFRSEKALIVQPVLPRTRAVLRWPG